MMVPMALFNMIDCKKKKKKGEGKDKDKPGCWGKQTRNLEFRCVTIKKLSANQNTDAELTSVVGMTTAVAFCG